MNPAVGLWLLRAMTAEGVSWILCSQSTVLCPLGQREQRGEDCWSNAQRRERVLKEVDFLACDEALGFTLVIFSIFGVLGGLGSCNSVCDTQAHSACERR